MAVARGLAGRLVLVDGGESKMLVSSAGIPSEFRAWERPVGDRQQKCHQEDKNSRHRGGKNRRRERGLGVYLDDLVRRRRRIKRGILWNGHRRRDGRFSSGGGEETTSFAKCPKRV